MACMKCNCGVCQMRDLSAMSKNWNECCVTCDQPQKPCKISSSVSCPGSPSSGPLRRPIFDYCKQYKICFPKESKWRCPSGSLSDSCLLKTHCFGFPIPREVANYYNRNNSKKKMPKCCPNAQRQFCRRKPPKVKVCALTKTCDCCPPKPPCPPRGCCCASCQKPCQPPPCSCRTCCPPRGCCAAKPCCPPVACCPPKQCCPPEPCCPPKTYCSTKQRCCSPRSCCPNNRPECMVEKRCMCQPQRDCPGCCGNNCCGPSDCKMSQIREVCQSICNRCKNKVYAAEKIVVACGAYHCGCFSCFCCRKLLDVRSVQEHCNEIYCKNCYNNLFGGQYYGYGSSQCC